MNFKRIISALLTLVMVFGAVVITANASTFSAYAAEEDANAGAATDTPAEEEETINYLVDAFETPEAKIATMELARSQDGYELYVEKVTGEIAFRDTKTGEILFSNPYDLAQGYNWASQNTRRRLLSQLSITFEQNGKSGELSMDSYTEAAMRDQIITKPIKNGVRVEYTIGELATERLVPRMISKDRFESMILNRITDEPNLNRLKSFYTLYDTSDTSLTERAVKEIQASFPITKQFAIYVCTPDITSNQLKTLETIVKTYCPTYTFEEMEQDHADCDYVASDEAPPNFRMAIEYTISEAGLEARLPANGIRFDESNFTLKSITMLPFMGSGSAMNTGYTFIPDGSGTLIRFEEVLGTNYSIAGQMYGTDYAYHDITEQHYEVMRLPVFGLVENRQVSSGSSVPGTESTTSVDDRGYFAVITEGDSMATLMSEHGGTLHAYNTVYASFEPRPSDKYSLSSTAASDSGAWTVTSSRRYMGSYRIQYYMLDDEKNVAETGRGYEASYVGMAEAYRSYLEDNGIITRLSADEVKADMPIYIESFGSIKTSDKFMSLPVTVDTALTSFDDIKTMYDELDKAGVSNINFRLTGYYNGGLDNTYPAKLKWVKNLGGEKGLQKLLNYADKSDFNVYPEFDLAYVKTTDWFDGVSDKRDLVKSIDDRYMSKKEYDAAMQTFESDFALAVSPSVYSYFLGKINKEVKGLKNMDSISVSTLGTELNSDFDEDDPYNREDSKAFTVEALQSLSKKYNVMVDGGNAYTLQYADHLINVPTESSNFLRASASVPFYAMVLHGYVNYTGSAINMEGDLQYAILKSIENGASLYFTLCYDNTSSLKGSDEYNRYYSVSYEDWKDELVAYYTEVNEALGDLQTTAIVDHRLVNATITVATQTEDLTEEELAALEQAKAEAEAAAKAEKEREEKRKQLLESRGETYKPSASGGGNRNPNASVNENEIETIDVVSGSVVAVTYEDGTTFVINYNSSEVEADIDGEIVPIEALSFVKIDSEKGGDK